MPKPTRILPNTFLTVGIIGIFLGAGRAHAGTFPYPIQTRTLDNGLVIHVVPMRGSPGVVAYGTWMSVGSRDEVEVGRTGFAHFFEHLMFHGTDTMPGPARESELLRLGAEDNAWTWVDETVYHGTIPTSSLPKYAEMEADRFQHLKLTPDGVRREAGAVYGEFRKGQADPQQVLYGAMQQLAFGVHTYGHDTLGYEKDIAAMPESYDAALAFFDRNYRPENAVVLVVGDVEPESVFTLLTGLYAGWSRGTTAKLPVPPEPVQDSLRRGNVDWPGSATPLLSMGWKVGPQHADDPMSARLQLAADLLSSPTGPLQRRLVREQVLAFAVHAGRDTLVDPGLFRIDVEARRAEDFPAIEAIVREEVAKLAAGVDPAELDRLRTRLRYRFLSALDDPMTVLNVLGDALRRDPDPAALDRYLDAQASATAEEVSAAVRDTFVDPHLTVVTLTPPAPPVTEETP